MKQCNCVFPRLKGYGRTGKPYGHTQVFAVDGIGRVHAKVLVRCDKCDGERHIANLHLALPDNFNDAMQVIDNYRHTLT